MTVRNVPGFKDRISLLKCDDNNWQEVFTAEIPINPGRNIGTKVTIFALAQTERCLREDVPTQELDLFSIS